LKLTLSMACAHKGCESKLKLETVVSDHSCWSVDALGAELGWRRLAGTKEIYCPEHSGDMTCVRCGFQICSCLGGPRFDGVRA
jgi:hypothetical protein